MPLLLAFHNGFIESSTLLKKDKPIVYNNKFYVVKLFISVECFRIRNRQQEKEIVKIIPKVTNKIIRLNNS